MNHEHPLEVSPDRDPSQLQIISGEELRELQAKLQRNQKASIASHQPQELSGESTVPLTRQERIAAAQDLVHLASNDLHGSGEYAATKISSALEHIDGITPTDDVADESKQKAISTAKKIQASGRATNRFQRWILDRRTQKIVENISRLDRN